MEEKPVDSNELVGRYGRLLRKRVLPEPRIDPRPCIFKANVLLLIYCFYSPRINSRVRPTDSAIASSIITFTEMNYQYALTFVTEV